MSQCNNVYLCIDIINKEMTLQQLEYIIAVEQHGYFVNAADACGVTQSTLSLMIKKLEEELDVKIFNRDTHPVTVTEMGRRVIDEAKMAVYHTKQLLELTRSAKEQSSGDLSIAMTTTVAPVLMPGHDRGTCVNAWPVPLYEDEKSGDTPSCGGDDHGDNYYQIEESRGRHGHRNLSRQRP